MRINPITNVSNFRTNQSRKQNLSLQRANAAQPSFQGLKGASIGAGVGLIWAGTIVGMCAIGAPYLLPIFATDALIGGAATGAFAGHCMEHDLKDNDNKKK